MNYHIGYDILHLKGHTVRTGAAWGVSVRMYGNVTVKPET